MQFKLMSPVRNDTSIAQLGSPSQLCYQYVFPFCEIGDCLFTMKRQQTISLGNVSLPIVVMVVYFFFSCILASYRH